MTAWRERAWEALARAEPVDLAVVGGGATGLGVALDAARRGYRVALFESHDWAAGTSSRSTKLLHGGVRYLAQGNLSLVREALAERTAVMAMAPHLAHALPFVVPCRRWWHRAFYGTGLWLYDRLAGRAALGPTEWLDERATRAAVPGVNPQGLRGSVRYWDGQFDDARLAVALARSAERAGAIVLNRAEVVGVERDPPGMRLRVSDHHDGRARTLLARCVVNATGVWVDALRQPSGGVPLVRPSQGVHLVVDREHLRGEHALLVPHTRDGRVLFAVPWLGKLVLGTTDTPRADIAREPEPLADEIDFILDEASAALARPLRRADVRSQWVGLRPLVSRGAVATTGAMSREHVVLEDTNGLVSVTGGKWTTHRAMADDVLSHCVRVGLLPARPSLAVGDRVLVGGDDAPGPGLQAAPGYHLFGSEAAAVRALPGADEPLGMGLTAAMVRFSVRCEHALTVEDVLARRWRSLFLDATEAAAMAPSVAAVMATEGIGDPGLAAFVALAGRYRPAAV